MSAADIERLLRQERQRLVDERSALRSGAGASDDPLALPEFERYGQDPNELASDTLEREIELSLELDLAGQVAEVDAALVRLRTGNYGVCESCGRTIDADRLAAMPATRRCLNDQVVAEQFSERSDGPGVPAEVMEDASSGEDDEIDLGEPAEEAAVHIEAP